MSLTRHGAIVASAAAALTLLAHARLASAQSAERDPFFVDKIDDEATERGSLVQGSLTLSTFFYRESADLSPAGDTPVEGASPAGRLFGDVRAQLDARHLGGGRWDVRVDGRLRYSAGASIDGDSNPETPRGGTIPVQSGLFGGNEYEVRELYAAHTGDAVDLIVGRQFVLDLAAVKIDGLRVDYARSKRWTLLGFAGLYPTRGSRSLDSDYPEKVDATGAGLGSPVMPVAGGAGAAYRYERVYGSLGAVAILPLADDTATGTAEKPRAFVTSQGYWRQSLALDVYHYAVVDLASASGAGVTNLSLGANWRPRPTMRITAALNHVDTETLNVQAQALLEDPSPGTLVQNNVEVLRIASDSARLGLSVAMAESRYEVSTSAAVRRRPEVVLTEGDATQVIGAAQQVEFGISAVDRRSLAGMRLGGHVLSIFGVGSGSLYHGNSNIVRVTGSREVNDGAGELELDASLALTADDSRGQDCNPAVLESCYGGSNTSTASLGALFFYRLHPSWMLVASANLGYQMITTIRMSGETSQPAILMTTGFARLAYRF